MKSAICSRNLPLTLVVGHFLLARAFGAGPTLKEIHTSFDLAAKLVPVVVNGELRTVEGENTPQPVIHVYSKLTSLSRSTYLTIPNAKLITVLGFSKGLDGLIAVGGDAFDVDGQDAPYLALLSTDGEALIVRTAPYHCNNVVVASDGTVWTAGGQDGGKLGNVVRHYDRLGKLINSFIAQKNTVRELADLASSDNFLISNSGNVLWYFAQTHQLFGFPSSGDTFKNLPALPLPSGATVSGMAITTGGTLVASIQGGQPYVRRLYVLHHGERAWTWSPLSERIAYVLGSDGENIVVKGLSPSALGVYRQQ